MHSAPSVSHVDIRVAQAADSRDMATLHAFLLPHGFFAKLGLGYLSTYHRSFMWSPAGVSLVAVEGGAIVGFIAGAIDAHAHQRLTIRRWGAWLAARGLVGLLLRPRLLVEFASTRVGRYGRGILRAARHGGAASGPGPDVGASGPMGVLAHVAVAPFAQGTGIGQALVVSFVDTVLARGTSRIELVTLSDEGASGFYERLGWSRIGEHHRDGRGYQRFRLDQA